MIISPYDLSPRAICAAPSAMASCPDPLVKGHCRHPCPGFLHLWQRRLSIAKRGYGQFLESCPSAPQFPQGGGGLSPVLGGGGACLLKCFRAASSPKLPLPPFLPKLPPPARPYLFITAMISCWKAPRPQEGKSSQASTVISNCSNSALRCRGAAVGEAAHPRKRQRQGRKCPMSKTEAPNAEDGKRRGRAARPRTEGGPRQGPKRRG